jgi:hypothetical protein
VPFDDLPVQPGSVYQVAATIVITGEDANPEDNEIRVQFEVNEG